MRSVNLRCAGGQVAAAMCALALSSIEFNVTDVCEL